MQRYTPVHVNSDFRSKPHLPVDEGQAVDVDLVRLGLGR